MKAWLALGAVLPTAALAQAQSCRAPDRIAVPFIARPADEAPRSSPVVGYTLALSWSPEFCRDHPGDDSEQCRASTGRFGFILHGLWPESPGNTAPRWCPSQRALTEAIVRAQFCTMPSTRLIAHEWAKHGACAARDPADYFAATRKIVSKVRLPDMMALSRAQIDVGAFKRTLSALNPAIPVTALAVDARGGWLSEVRLCLDRVLGPEPCPRARPRGSPDTTPLRIWRGGGR